MLAPLLLLTDSRFPAGGYAHSGGLEAAVEDGLAADEVPAFLARPAPRRRVARGLSCGRRAAGRRRRGAPALDVEALARCPSPPLRRASSRLGSQLLRTAATVWPGDPGSAYRAASVPTPRPVAFGAVAAVAGLDDRETAHAYLYEDAATVTTAAVRLLPVDGATAARWLVEAAPELDRLALEAADSGLPGGFAPALELGSLAHAAREGRLFAS